MLYGKFVKKGGAILNFIGNDYDNYARCKVDYSDEYTENDEFSQNFIITDDEGNVIDEFCEN